jgi:hypothetical protein
MATANERPKVTIYARLANLAFTLNLRDEKQELA